MATLNVWQKIAIDTADGTRHEFGDLSAPVKYSVTDALIYRRVYEVADDATQLIFSVSNSDLASFAFLGVKSNQDNVFLEMVTDDGNEVGEESYTIELKKDCIQPLFSDDSYALHTVAFAAGTADSIETLRVENKSGSVARIEVFGVQAT